MHKETIEIEYTHSGQRRKYGDTYREAVVTLVDSKMSDDAKKRKATIILWALTQYGRTMLHKDDKREWHQAYVSKVEVQPGGRVFVQITEPSTH